MPVGKIDLSGKQKRKAGSTQKDLTDSGKRRKVGAQDKSEDITSKILSLETGILENRKNYNSIVKLLDFVNDESAGDDRNVLSAIALCRIFCRLLALDALGSTKGKPENEVRISQWLSEKLDTFEAKLLQMLEFSNHGTQNTALTLLMRLLKHKAKTSGSSGDGVWQRGLFPSILRPLLSTSTGSAARNDFVTEYLAKYHDIRFYTYSLIPHVLSSTDGAESLPHILATLSAIPPPIRQEDESAELLLEHTKKRKNELCSVTAHQRQAQKVWLSMMRKDLTKAQRKVILDLVATQISPCFTKPELLMDFLTDSFNAGGSTTLLALSGLFHLMAHKNLDYPQFYHKLYSLLDAEILHSKHRSRFFRLLETFLASTHLPAVLVASFIKRLSRLSLYAPASGIVFVVPWIYNLLQNHPSCTFMIHRNGELENQGDARWKDPFLMQESNPMETRAIESSLWELHTLQSHYHPNVAAIAKIISQQFTKQGYNLEDFLDHSYATMIEAELSKPLKKPPEIEYEIPKKIFTKFDPQENMEDDFLVRMWEFS